MDTIKASELTICIFTPKDLPLDQYPDDEKAVWAAIDAVIQDLRAKHGINVPIYWGFCPLTNPQNQLIVARLDINDFPGVQLFATYPDGKTAEYGLRKDVGDILTGVNWTAEDVRPYIEALLYAREPADSSILCRFFPPLCSLGGWVWLAGAVFSAWKFSETKSAVGKIIWGAAAGLTWQSFAAGGGFKKIGL